MIKLTDKFLIYKFRVDIYLEMFNKIS